MKYSKLLSFTMRSLVNFLAYSPLFTQCI